MSLKRLVNASNETMDPPEPAHIEHIDEILEEYKNLNEKCEKVINKIKTRKASKKVK
jgi:hypothetical protein